MKILYPKCVFDRVEDISYDFVKEHNIKGFIMDIDNTLVPWDSEPEESVLAWIELMKSFGIKLCLLSNNKKGRINYISNKLNIPVLFGAKKPFKSGFVKAINFLNLDSSNIAVIGDQIFTDILGGNRNGLYTIFVNPRSSGEHFITKLKRPFEKFVLSRYMSMEEKFDE